MPATMLRDLAALAEAKGVTIGALIRDAVSRDLRVRSALATPGLPSQRPLLHVRPQSPTTIHAD